jgi:hypothetical protein
LSLLAMRRRAYNWTNKISSGDVIMMSGADGKMHHVMAAVSEDPEDYRKVVVMSLWDGIGGGGFTKVPLGIFLNEKKTLRHASL